MAYPTRSRPTAKFGRMRSGEFSLSTDSISSIRQHIHLTDCAPACSGYDLLRRLITISTRFRTICAAPDHDLLDIDFEPVTRLILHGLRS